MTHADLLRWDREIVWHAFTQMSEYTPFLIERAEGCTLFDSDGRAYLDGVSSLWCNIHGHRHPRLDAALVEQLGKVAHVTSLGSSNSTTVRLARRLTELAPTGLDRVFFSDNGATAVEVALKMAFQYWQQRADPQPRKTKFIAYDSAYHGDTLGGVSVGGVARFQAMFRPLLFDALRLPAPDTYRLPEGVSESESLSFYLAQLESLLEQQHEEVAALIIEPLVQCAAGIIVHPPGYFAGVRALTRRFNVLLIADEVAVGFGRTGTLFACEQEQVRPDFMCLAKGITGGYLPLAATLTTTDVWNAFLGHYSESKSFFHGHTYGGNPLGAAVALASLDVFEAENTLAAMQEKVAAMARFLKQIAEFEHVGSVRQRGLIAGVELVRNKERREPYPWAEKRGIRACEVAKSHGVLLRPLGNVVVLMPPLAISLAELDCIFGAVTAGIGAATSALSD